MTIYKSDELRNVVLLGHGGAGKTSLAEAMLFDTGAVKGDEEMLTHQCGKKRFPIHTIIRQGTGNPRRLGQLSQPGRIEGQ